MIWRARHHTVTFPRRPLIMGIVNINDDSFCGVGTLDPRPIHF
jgi:dihydropteroate synthase